MNILRIMREEVPSVKTYRWLVTYARTNRQVRWDYSEYCGRWATVEEAIKAVREVYPDGRVEYRIENRNTDEVITGFLD